MKKDEIFLKHMLESIGIIEEQMKNKTKNEFIKSISFHDAVIRRLEIIGEASKNLSQEFRDNHRSIEWKRIVGLRNVLIHGYFDVDLNLTWEILVGDLPDLKKRIRKILKETTKK